MNAFCQARIQLDPSTLTSKESSEAPQPLTPAIVPVILPVSGLSGLARNTYSLDPYLRSPGIPTNLKHRIQRV